MNSINDDFILKCQAGIPVLYEDICALYPRTLRDIAEVDYTKFRIYLQTILVTKPILEEKNELNELIEKLTDYQYFLLLTQVDQEFNSYAKQAFMFFCKEQVTFSTELAQIIIGPIAEKHIMDEEKFTFFQKMLKRMYFVDDGGQDDIVINDSDPENVKKLKRTMLKNRERVARAKAKERAKKGEGGELSFSDLIGSFAIGTDQNLNDVYNLTYYAFHDQLKRMGWREEYNTNTRAAFAGAKIKKEQLVYWIRSIKQ